VKVIALVAFVFLIHSSLCCQTRTNDYKAMVDSAVVMQKAAYKQNIYLIDEQNHSYALADTELQKRFSYINLFEKRNRKRLKKGIRAWKIFPVLNGNRLTINIVDFTITYKRNNYAFGNGGGATVIFEYYCNEGKWVLVESKWSGL
jgi:hypothetical protein